MSHIPTSTADSDSAIGLPMAMNGAGPAAIPAAPFDQPGAELAEPAFALWLTPELMQSGDQFELTHIDSGPLTVTHVDFAAELQMVDMALVKVAELELAMTLPASGRFRMVRAERAVTVACLLCGATSDDLCLTYDLAQGEFDGVVAVCNRCTAGTLGTIHGPAHTPPPPRRWDRAPAITP